jgi:hypothetical protein
MKLAEALALRSDAAKRYEQLRSRAHASARYQEGEEPAESATQLVGEAERVLAELEDLIRRINRTNSVTRLDDELSITDAIARRDVLKLRHSLVNSVADAASGGTGRDLHMLRQMRSELRYVTDVPVAEMRAAADEIARQYRDLDIRIQQANWQADLAE